jgi:hypothetical protein
LTGGGGGLCGTNGPVIPGGGNVGWVGTKVHCFGRLAGWLNRWLFEHRQGEPWQIWQGGGGLLVVVGGGTVGGPGFGGGGGTVKAGGGAGDPGLKFALGFRWRAGGGAGMPGSCTAAVAAAAEMAHETSEGRGT